MNQSRSKEILIVPPELAGASLDEFLSLRFPRIAKGQLRRLIRMGKVSVDGTVEANPKPLHEDAIVMVDWPKEKLPEMVETKQEIRILYEDESMLCVDKPAGIAVEPERWKKEAGSLIAAMLTQLESSAEGKLAYRPRLAHRLDKGTSGVLVLAKTLEAESHLRKQFQHREVNKEYLAIVEGEVPGEGGEVDLPIGQDPSKPGKMQIDRRKGDEAQTRYEVAERFRGFTVVKAFPKTGRTHQIRLHLAARGFPLLVDELYGKRSEFLLSSIKSGYRLQKGHREKPLLDRLSLHAHKIELNSLAAGKISVEAPIPEDLQFVLEKMRKYRPCKKVS